MNIILLNIKKGNRYIIVEKDYITVNGQHLMVLNNQNGLNIKEERL